MKIIPVILSGGVGTRLWPRSRDILPKQFLNLTDDSKTLLQQTLLRVSNQQLFSPPIILCNIKHKFLLQENCAALGIEPLAMIFEPFGKNTAPAIAAAAEWIISGEEDDGVMLVLPADHYIPDNNAFLASISHAYKAAKENKLVTFGISPSYPATGYGYIEQGSELAGHQHIYEVNRFIEKPDKEKAKDLVEDKRHFWNSGMFLMKAKQYLAELERYEPEIKIHAGNALLRADTESNYYLLDEKEFGQCADLSIDYAIMERTDNVAVLPLDLSWSDVGSWQAVYELSHKDADGNSTQGEVTLHNTENCFVDAEHGLLALVGVKDLVVVSTKDAVLVAHKERTEEIKELAGILRKAQRKEFYHSPRVQRPWGYYEDLQEGVCFRVKRLCIMPKQKISLQFHQKRSEHWIVVSGIATVTHNKKTYTLAPGESTYINVGEHHRLENNHKTPLEIIEVQTGSYVGEDDIVRLQDIYGREETVVK
jgi:mannose-1-phosphate guanylyltransferase/mannose-6-phosphate isomerase